MSITKIAESVTVPIDSLQLWERNPRSIKTERFTELKERLKRQGQIKPLLVAADGKTVIGGNMRLRAMQELGITEVWVSQTEAKTDKDIFDLALTDNEEFGYYEQEQVAELALELGLSPLELKSYALSLGEPTTLDLVVDKFGPEPDEADDEAPEVDETNPPVSKLGEVYQLGEHRLMCGSATSVEAVEQLMDGAKADMVFTDPPYGMDLDTDWTALKGGGDYKNRSGGSEYTKVIGDDKDYDPTHIFEMFDCKEIFLWGADYYAEMIPNRKQGSWLVWDKRNDNEQLDKIYGSAFELCWSKQTHKRELVRITWAGIFGFNKSEDGDSRSHPTQKPIKLCTWFLNKYGERGQIVVDVFGGSGSTLIACEQTNRTCYMMELDPKYCDVIRKRYAKHIGEEESWQEVTPVVNQLQPVS